MRIVLTLLWINCLYGNVSAQCCLAGKNIVINGNFSMPAVSGSMPIGFRTQNAYVDYCRSAGDYSIIRERGYGACDPAQYDHTSGNESGQFLWFDTSVGADMLDPDTAWVPYDDNKPASERYALKVSPGKTYIFSAWVRDIGRNFDCITGGAPVAALAINGATLITRDLQPNNNRPPCCPDWINLCAEWQSGSDSVAFIMIQSMVGDGNTDLGIDDIYFGEKISKVILTGSEGTYCGDGLTLTSNLDTGNFIWNTGETSATITATHTGKYWLNVKKLPHCHIKTDTINIATLPEPDKIQIPNIFTPDGDGINDFFYPVIDCRLKQYSLIIYNRWGMKLFETYNQYDKWDGRSNNTEAPDGTYYYMLTRDDTVSPGVITITRGK